MSRWWSSPAPVHLAAGPGLLMFDLAFGGLCGPVLLLGPLRHNQRAQLGASASTPWKRNRARLRPRPVFRVWLGGPVPPGHPTIWSRREAAGRKRRELAGTSQSEVQVGRRKPVIQGAPAGEILSGSPGAGIGRGGCSGRRNRRHFADVQAQSDRPVWGEQFRESAVAGRPIADAGERQLTGSQLALPAHSLERSANDRPRGPVWRYAVHFCQPGPGVLLPLPTGGLTRTSRRRTRG